MELQRTLKIALISDWFTPRRGGIESHLSELKARLTQAGHDVHVVTTTPGPNDDRVHRVTATRLPWAGVLFTPNGARALHSAVDAIRPDVVHSHVSIVSPASFLGARHAQRRGIPTVVTFHSFIPATRPYMRGVAAVTGSRSWRAVFTAVSERVAHEVQPFGGAHVVGLLPNAVDIDYWRPSSNSPRGEEKPLRIVAALRLNAKKRPQVLIRLGESLRNQLPAEVDFEILVAGDGPMRHDLMTAIRRKGLDDKIRVLGHLSREQLRELYHSSDLFVLPTVRESFGLAALEARATGLPVIAMRASALAEQIVDGENGLLATTDAEFVGCVERLVIDRPLREAIGRRNRGTPLALDWPRCLRSHETTYASAIELMADRSGR